MIKKFANLTAMQMGYARTEYVFAMTDSKDNFVSLFHAKIIATKKESAVMEHANVMMDSEESIVLRNT